MIDSGTIPIDDGRVIGFAEYGSKTGKPVLFFHGFPGSRLEIAHYDQIAKNNNLY